MTKNAPLHDYSRSRAVLIGTSAYRHLPSVTAAAKSLDRMTSMLMSDLCGWPSGRISVFRDVPGPGDLPDRLITLFEEAKDIALFYFVGHGQIDVEDHLCLGLEGSRPEPHRRASTSLQFGSVRQAMLGSPATTKIIILDCCFAGLANKPSNTLGTPADLLEKASGTGAYTMAACSAYTTAWYERRVKKGDEDQTYFTKYLVDIVEDGIPGEPAALRLQVVFKRLRENLAYDRRPLPEARNIDAAGDFLFAYNSAPPPARVDAFPRAHHDGQVELTPLTQLSEALTNFYRRSQSLADRQIRLLNELKQSEDDPKRLSGLHQIDRLATRIRRNSENLLALAGYDNSGWRNQPVQILDLLRAAISEIEEYERVTLKVRPGIAVKGPSVPDAIHLIAELVENATIFSPADTPINIVGHLLDSGETLLEITDQGVGMCTEEIARANWQLDNPSVTDIDVTVPRRMGLFVVARLAAKDL